MNKLEELKVNAKKFYQEHKNLIELAAAGVGMCFGGLLLKWAKKSMRDAIWEDRATQIGKVIHAMHYHLEEAGITDTQFQTLVDKTIKPV